MILYMYHVNTGNYYIVRDSMTFGRTTGHITFADDSSMSGQHTQIVLDRANNKVWVEDLNSKNHTIVDRVEIPPHDKVAMKLYSLLEMGQQKFILFDNRNASKDMIEQILEDKQKITVGKLAGTKLVGDLKERLNQEISKLNSTHHEFLMKLNRFKEQKAEALKEYEEKIAKIDSETIAINTQMETIYAQIQERAKRLEKLTTTNEAATMTILKQKKS
jgi:chromosome segregation ATPase